MMQRQSKLMSLAQAVGDVRDASTLGLGGWCFNSQPMALIRGLIKRGVRNLHLVPSPGSIGPDLLIGAGCVASTACVFISFEQFGLAPQFRRAAESGSLKVHEMDGPGFAGGLRAGACDLPWMPIPDMATDLPRVNPEHYRRLPREPGERPLLAARALKPDVSFIHAQQADEFGNVQFLGAAFFDVALARASRRVIVSVDRIVSPEAIRQNNRLTKLPRAFVHAVVEAPFGAHPSASGSVYRADLEHLEEYVKASADPARYQAYLERYVQAPSDHSQYLDICRAARLAGLMVSESNVQ